MGTPQPQPQRPPKTNNLTPVSNTPQTPKTTERPVWEQFQALASQPMPKQLIWALVAALAISALSIGLMQAFDGAAKVRHWIESAGAWAPLAYISLKAATYVVAPLSGTPVKLAGGALFGFWDGALYVLAGDMLGASLNFWIARLFRDRGIRRLAGRKAIRQIDGLTKHAGGWRALLVARLLLSSLYDFISYAAGLSYLPFKQFFLVSLLAGIPSTLSSAWIGNAAVTNQKLMVAVFVVSALALGVLMLRHHAGKDAS